MMSARLLVTRAVEVSDFAWADCRGEVGSLTWREGNDGGKGRVWESLVHSGWASVRQSAATAIGIVPVAGVGPRHGEECRQGSSCGVMQCSVMSVCLSSGGAGGHTGIEEHMVGAANFKSGTRYAPTGKQKVWRVRRNRGRGGGSGGDGRGQILARLTAFCFLLALPRAEVLPAAFAKTRHFFLQLALSL